MNEDNYVDAIVKIDKVQYSLYELKRKYDERKDIILNPDFQRGDAWKTDRQKSELIESVLLGVPIPLFYFFETKSGVMEVVDGRQRITTFIDFFNNKFPLTYLPYLSNLNTLYFKDLAPKLQAKIEDYQIMINVIQPPTPERMKFDIFNRINRGGTELSNQEIRNARYYGSASTLLGDLSSKDIFIKSTNNELSSFNMEDREWVLHFFYVYLLKILNYKFTHPYDIEECLNETMQKINKYDDLSELKNMFEKAMTISYQLFQGDGFRFDENEKLNINLFEALSYLYMILNDNRDMKDLKVKIEDIKDEFKVMDEFNSRDLKENKFKFDRVEDLKENTAFTESIDSDTEDFKLNIDKLNWEKLVKDLKDNND